MKVLQVEDIEKSKKRKKILKGLSFSVDEQEIVGLLGPNGSGKSTTIKCISGLYRTDRGRIRICGNDIKSNRLEALKQIGIAMEVPALYPELSGIQNLRMAATARKVPKERVEELAVFTDLGDRLLDRTGTYSMGMKMRLNLAIAIVDQPKLVILDEPTNGLDPAGIQEMRELICELPERFGMTVVVSSHLLSEIDQMADHVAIIRDGELVFQDTLEALHGRSRHHLALRTTNNAVARAILQEKSVPCQEEEGYLILPILSDELAGQFTRLLGARNLGVIRLEERQKSLEDIFLELTGKAASL